MKVLQFPLTKITICFVAGILLAHNVKPDFQIVAALLGAALLLFGVAFYYAVKRQQKIYFGIVTFCLSCCIGASTLTVHNSYFQKSNYIHHVQSSDEVHTLEVILREKLKNSVYNDRYVALVKAIDRQKSTGKLIVNLNKQYFHDSFPIGTKLMLKGKIIKHRKPLNPDQFDYGEYLTNKSILSQIYVNGEDVRISNIVVKDPFYYSALLRDRIVENLEKSHFGKTELAVVAALILGQQQDISPEILHDYQFAGAIHILSVSGLHVGFILLFLNLILNYLPKNRIASYLKLSIIILALWGFAILAGLSPSVIRSVTMFSFVALGMHLKRKTNIFHTLLVSLFLILLFEPSFLFDIGFQLSYVALFFILWLQPLLSNIWIPKNKVLNYFWEILTVSFAAQIGTFPLSVYYFHQFPGLFFITNLIIIPFLSIIMALGVGVIIMAAFGYIPVFLAKLLEWSVFVLNEIISWIASFEQFIFRDIPFNSYMLVGLYILIIASIIAVEKPDFKRLAIAITALIIFQASYFGARWSNQNKNEWIVFNSRKATLIAERFGEDVFVYTNAKIEKNNPVQSYLVANFCRLQSLKPLQNIAFFDSKKIIILDSTGVYPKNANPDILVLRQSPQLNLDRVLLNYNPKMIVADASNYKSYVARWKNTCLNKKIPFHATAEKGFYRLQ